MPTILAWCWYGKRPGEESEEEWATYGLPPGTHSQMVKFEGPDPAYWCKHGYAVVNADPRGAGNSEGRLVLWGHTGRPGRPRRDRVDRRAAVVERPGGHVRELRPGHVPVVHRRRATAALGLPRPWERHVRHVWGFASENGIPAPGFMDFVTSIGRSASGLVENYSAMLREYPLVDVGWPSSLPCSR